MRAQTRVDRGSRKRIIEFRKRGTADLSFLKFQFVSKTPRDDSESPQRLARNFRTDAISGQGCDTQFHRILNGRGKAYWKYGIHTWAIGQTPLTSIEGSLAPSLSSDDYNDSKVAGRLTEEPLHTPQIVFLLAVMLGKRQCVRAGPEVCGCRKRQARAVVRSCRSNARKRYYCRCRWNSLSTHLPNQLEQMAV